MGKGAISARRLTRSVPRGRGRDEDCSSPPAQIRTCGFPAYGSHLGSKRPTAVAVVRMQPASVTRAFWHCVQSVRCWPAFPLASALRSISSAADRSRLVRRLPSYYGLVRLPAPVHHRLRLLAFPMRTLGASCHRPDAGSPSFRRDLSTRDVLFDPGRVSRTSHNGTAHVAFGSKGMPPPPAIRVFRGSITHPVQQLCTLRGRRYLRLTQHSPPGGALRLTWAGLAPADPASLLAPSLCPPYVPRASSRIISASSPAATAGSG